MAKRLYGQLTTEAKRYWRFFQANPPEPMTAEVAKEGAGSELRSPLFHFGTVMPVYLSVVRYLSREKSLRGKRLVELGSGSGRALSYLQAMFPEMTVMGTDYSQGCIEYARAVYGMYGVEFVHTPAQKTVLRAGSFDYVISSHVIEHIRREDGSAFLTETVRLLKKGGKAFIGTPERRMSQDLYAKNPQDLKSLRLVPPHEHEYTYKELLTLGKTAASSVKVEKLVNPVFRKLMRASISKFKPGTSIGQRAANYLYIAGRDWLPRPWFDLVTRLGARLTMSQQGISYQDLLAANELVSGRGSSAADNLLLILEKR